MAKTRLYFVCAAFVALWACGLHAAEDKPKDGASSTRIGVYDSRAVAVAFAGSAAFNKQQKSFNADVARAKASNDQKELDKLKATSEARQQRMHNQGFSTEPVTDVLDTVKGELPGVEKKANVSALVSKWDKEALAKYPNATQVDVTPDLIDLFKPSDRQRKSAVAIQKVFPRLPLDPCSTD